MKTEQIQEIIQRNLLLINYDSSKTLNEQGRTFAKLANCLISTKTWNNSTNETPGTIKCNMFNRNSNMNFCIQYEAQSTQYYRADGYVWNFKQGTAISDMNTQNAIKIGKWSCNGTKLNTDWSYDYKTKTSINTNLNRYNLDSWSGGTSGDSKSQKNTTQSAQKRTYKKLNDNFKIYSFNKEHIGKLQSCLKMSIPDKEIGFFGPKTFKALKNTTEFSAITNNTPITVQQINDYCTKKTQELTDLNSQEIKTLPNDSNPKSEPVQNLQQNAKTQNKPLNRAERRQQNASKSNSQNVEGD